MFAGCPPRWRGGQPLLPRPPRKAVSLARSGLMLPQVPVWAEPAWHLFVVRHPKRDVLMKRLNEAGVGSLIHYPVPPHLQEAYTAMGFRLGTFPVAERLAKEVVSLPMGPQMAAERVDVIYGYLRV